MKFLDGIIFEHPQEAISLMFETETDGSLLVWKLKWGGIAPLAPSVAAPMQRLINCYYNSLNCFRKICKVKLETSETSEFFSEFSILSIESNSKSRIRKS